MIKNTIAIMSYHPHHQQQNAMVGSLRLKEFSHWDDKINRKYCTERGIPLYEQQGNYWDRSYVSCYKDKRSDVHDVKTAMVALQRSLFKAAKCEDNNLILTGELYKRYYNNKDKQVKEYYRTPFHDDLLENWGKRYWSILILHNFHIQYVPLLTYTPLHMHNRGIR